MSPKNKKKLNIQRKKLDNLDIKLLNIIKVRTEIIKNNVIIESRSPEEAEKKLLGKYENSDDPLTDFPDGWCGHINSEELKIDEIEKIWEY